MIFYFIFSGIISFKLDQLFTSSFLYPMLGDALFRIRQDYAITSWELLLSSSHTYQCICKDIINMGSIHVGTEVGYHSCVQLLLEHGANANARDNIGITAVIAAVSNHLPCILDKLHDRPLKGEAHAGHPASRSIFWA